MARSSKLFSILNNALPKGAAITIAWFFNDFVLRYKKRLSVIVLLGLSAASIQGGILFLINSFITKSQLTETLYGIALNIYSEISIEFFLLAIIIVGLTSSAAFVFLQARLTLGLWRRYQIHSINSLLDELRNACLRGMKADDLQLKVSPIPKVLRSAQRMGAFTRLVTNSILPLMRFLIFIAFAFYSDPVMTTLIILIAAPIGMIVLYLSARNASRNDFQAESLVLKSSREYDQRIKAAATLNSDYQISHISNDISSSIMQRADRLLSSLIGAERTRFIISILTIFLLAAVTIISGGGGDERHWGEVLVYLVALIMAFSQLSNVLSTASLFGRFYPTVIRYRELCDWLKAADQSSDIKNALSNISYQVASGPEVDEINLLEN